MPQTTVQHSVTVRFGSAKFEMGASVGSLDDVGALRDAMFEETWDAVEVWSHNAGIVKIGIRNHKASLGGNLMEINLAVLGEFYAGVLSHDTIAASPVNITDEPHALDGYELEAFTHRNGAGTVVASIVVADAASPTITYIRDCDYTVVLKPNGFTAIARTVPFTLEAASAVIAVELTSEYVLSAGAYDQLPAVGDHIYVTGFTEAANNGCKTVTIAEAAKITVSETLVNEVEGDTITIVRGAIQDGATVYADYDYTPLASRKLTGGGLTEFTAKVCRFTNTDINGKVFRITVYSATPEGGIKIDFPADEDEDPAMTPIKMVGTLDVDRTAGDQLFEIFDEQHPS